MVVKVAAGGGGQAGEWNAETNLSLFHARNEMDSYGANGGYPKPATITYLQSKNR